MQQGIADVDVEAQQQLDDLQVLVLDGDQQGRAAEGVDTVDVDLEVDLRLLTNEKSWDQGFVSAATLVLGFAREPSIRGVNTQ